MPRIVLASSLVAYNLYSLLNGVDKQTPYSCCGLQVQYPDATVEAANVASVLKIGAPDSWTSPTTVSRPELALQPGDSDMYPTVIGNRIPLRDKWVNSTVNNAVLYVDYEVA